MILLFKILLQASEIFKLVRGIACYTSGFN